MTEKTTVPAIYGALSKVLAAMSVEKGGTLPNNMGGKPYITAVDLNSEAKRQFVANNIIMLPQEKEIKHEVLVDADKRKTVVISVEGTYTLVSTEDGSNVVIGGVGDGLAVGTAVASNIASTNALKNALLRTFLVTEQSTEDAAKNEHVEKPAPAAVQRANTPPAAAGPVDAAKAEELNAVRAELGKLLPMKELTPKGNEFFGTQKTSDWSGDVDKLKKLLTHLKTGEV